MKLALALLFLVASAPSLAGTLPLAGTRNPDPARVQQHGDNLVEVTACGSTELVGAHPLAAVSPYQEDVADLGGDAVTADVRNVQWAVQNVAPGGLVRLRPGPRGEAFQFARSGIYLPGVRLTGAGRDESGAPRTVIEGGQLVVRIDFLVPGDRAAVSDLWFQDTLEGAIYTGMADYDRLEVSGNRSTGTVAEPFLVHPPEGQFFAGDLHFFVLGNGAAAVAPFTGAHAPRCNIREVIVRNNVSDQSSPASGSELEFAFCKMGSLRVTANEVRSRALPVELHQNRAGSLEVSGNTLSAQDTTVLWVFGNEAQSVQLESNHVSASGGGAVGMILSHHTPGALFTVSGNQLDLQGATAAVFLGFSGDALNGAVFSDNRFTGSAAFGVLAYDTPPVLDTSGNDLFFRNDFTAFTAYVLDVFLDANTHDDVFQQNVGLTSFFSVNPTNLLQ